MSETQETGQNVSASIPRWALIGSPNSGKSTLFNALTGLRTKVANYPGVTVDWFEGTCDLGKEQKISLVDLPGTYSVEALSAEEQVALDVLQGKVDSERPFDGVVFVADSTSLQRTLPLLGDFLNMLDVPVVVALTMLDELKARRGSIRPLAMKGLLGVPVVGIVGHRGVGIDDLKAILGAPSQHARTAPKEPIPTEMEERFTWGDKVLEASYQPPKDGTQWTDRLDKILLHPFWGIVIFAAVMVFFFQAIFNWAAPLQDLFEGGVTSLGQLCTGWLSPGLLRSVLVDGVIAGVGGVVVFVPQIALLFLLLAIFEQCGYMSRAVFVIDRVMGWVGLDGRSFVALLSSHACAVPGIMAARNIPDPKNRLVTILAAPFMTCSARLPVYTLLIAAFVPAITVWGFFQLQGLVMLGLYLLGAFGGLFFAMLLRKGVMRGATLPFYIELPPYRLPTAKALWLAVWGPVESFLKRVGTVILVCSIVLWALMNFPQVEAPKQVKKAGDKAVAAYQVQHSYAGKFGQAVEPAIAPLGFDWRVGIGLFASLAAREVFVGTMAQIYSIEESEESAKLSKRFRARLHPIEPYKKNPYGQLAVALALLMFFVFALQCISTLAVMRRETHSWKWPIIAFFVFFAIAYVAALIAFHVTIAAGAALA